VLFKEGWGVLQDKRAAASWYVRAAEHGFEDAKAALRTLAEEGVAEAAEAVERLNLAAKGVSPESTAAADGAAEASAAAGR
jgi:hypothetical protein